MGAGVPNGDDGTKEGAHAGASFGYVRRGAGIRATAVREAARIRNRRILLCLLFVFPAVSFLILVGVFHNGVPSELPVMVCDQDGSSLSRRIVRMIDATRTIRVVSRVADPAEGMRHLQDGSSYAVILIPDNMERDVFRGTGGEVIAWSDGQWLLAESLIRNDLQRAVGTVSAGVEIRTRQKKGDLPEQAVVQAEPIGIERHTLFNPNMNYLVYLLPGLIPAMLQILIIMAAVLAVGSEIRDGTAGEWVDAAGGSIWKALIGKLLPYAAHFLVVTLCMLALLSAGFGVPCRGNALWIMAGSGAFVAACLGAAVALVAWTANLRLATSLASFYSGPAFAFSGMTFPMIGMPPAGKIWGALLPLTHYLRLLVEQGIRGGPSSVACGATAALLAFVVIGGLSVLRLGRIAGNPAYWGRT